MVTEHVQALGKGELSRKVMSNAGLDNWKQEVVRLSNADGDASHRLLLAIITALHQAALNSWGGRSQTTPAERLAWFGSDKNPGQFPPFEFWPKALRDAYQEAMSHIAQVDRITKDAAP